MIVLIRRSTVLFIAMLIIVSYLTITISKHRVKDSIALSTHKVVLDAGHGGFDGGAVGKSGSVEKDLNLQIALKLQKKLEKAGYEVIMTRTDDSAVSPHEDKRLRIKKRDDMNTRVKIMNESGADVFLSIHMNTFTQSQYYGAQVFYSTNDARSKVLGKIIQEELRKVSFKKNDRVAKPADSSVFILKQAKIPAVIVECGFISNEEEELMLMDEKYQEKIAQAILDAVNKYFEEGSHEDLHN
ncbi:MAG: N-acetylmuramoyl-L-alanine amidase CwlD [Clostridiaceae bacterium]|nr:N-acetylmuramoyl-L-alanine amidase CwlD [Clostridiaceae bacterium]